MKPEIAIVGEVDAGKTTLAESIRGDQEKQISIVRSPASSLIISALPAMMMSAMVSGSMARYEGVGRSFGLRSNGRGGTPPMKKNLDNSPDRAKGMRAFHFSEQRTSPEQTEFPTCIIYAGTLKAARKKYWLLRAKNKLPEFI